MSRSLWIFLLFLLWGGPLVATPPGQTDSTYAGLSTKWPLHVTSQQICFDSDDAVEQFLGDLSNLSEGSSPHASLGGLGDQTTSQCLLHYAGCWLASGDQSLIARHVRLQI